MEVKTQAMVEKRSGPRVVAKMDGDSEKKPIGLVLSVRRFVVVPIHVVKL